MNDLLVVAACTAPGGLLERYRSQLGAAGIPLAVDPLEEPPNGCGNLAFKLKTTRDILERHGKAQRLVLTDAWDVLFYGTAEEVWGKIPETGTLMAAERNCWPDLYLGKHFKGDSPWKFANGGCWCGTPQAISDWCDAVERHPAYIPEMIDQQWMNHRILQGDALVTLDMRTDLFYCMMLEQGTLEFRGGLYNPICRTRPNFLHFNGHSGAHLWPYVEKAAELGIHAGVLDQSTGEGARKILLGVGTQQEADRLKTAGAWPE